jgi:hypothetical protein
MDLKIPKIPHDPDLDLVQASSGEWGLECLGQEALDNPDQRNHRFYEESTELVQATGMTREACHRMVDHVFDRPVGEPAQEIGGVMISLSLLANKLGLSVAGSALMELERAWDRIPEIREKQKLKMSVEPPPPPTFPEWNATTAQQATIMLLYGTVEQKKQSFAFFLHHQVDIIGKPNVSMQDVGG